jgi:hypothetical protein
VKKIFTLIVVAKVTAVLYGWMFTSPYLPSRIPEACFAFVAPSAVALFVSEFRNGT